MQRVKRSTAVAVLPAAPPGGTPGYFATPNPAGGVPATVPGNEWFNNVQEELMAVIEGQGLTASDTDRTQLRQAIAKMIQAGQRAVIINNATFAGAVTGTGKAVYWDSANSRFDLAVADGSAKQNCVGFADVPNGNVYAFGDAVLFAGLTPGARYYLDGSTPGALTTVVPANAVFVGIARGATEVFVDIDGQPSAIVSTVQAAFKNLQLSATGVSASISVSYDELVLGDGNGNYGIDRNVAGAINTTNSGAGGLDTGTLSASTWYSIWRIGKTDGTCDWLFSLSATTPFMPNGYTLKARIGWFRTDSTGNKYPLSMLQYGRKVQYKVAAGSNVAAYPAIASGVGGSYSQTVPTYVAASILNFVPPTASSIGVTLLGRYGNLSSGECNAAPNASFSGSSSSNPPPLHIDGTTTGILTSATMLIESSNVYYSAQSSGCALLCTGWEDSL